MSRASRRRERPKLLAVATAVPPYALDQQDVEERVRVQFGSRSSAVARLLPVFANTGIERRYSCVPMEWYYGEHGWPDRNRAYLDAAVPLLESATRDVLARAGRSIEEVAGIIVVSTTGIATPSLDALLMERMPFARTVRRLPIVGLGCAGGALGVARAATHAAGEPGELILLLVVELCGLSFRRDDFTKSNIVATALFGDGAAAALITTDGDGPAIVDSGEYTFPDSLDIMGWDVAPDGLKAIFSRDIPQLVERELRTRADAYLARSGLTCAQIDAYLCHPGGAKVLDALESAFGLPAGALVESRAILREYGNMSAATVLFVIERSLASGTLAGSAWRRALVSAMGPGFTTAFVTLERE